MNMISKWAHLARAVWLSNFDSLPSPYKLTYAVTSRCNSRCRFCGVWQKKATPELTLDDINSLARNMPALQWIDFTGGEPTLRPDLADIIAAFKKWCPALIYVHFPTNGLQPEKIAAVCNRVAALRLPRFIVTVSIDGPPAIHDELRGVPDAFARASETIRQLRALDGVEVFVGMTLYGRNVNSIDDTVSALVDAIPGFSGRGMHLNFPHRSDHFYGNADADFCLAPDAITSTVEKLKQTRHFPTTPFALVERMYQDRIPAYFRTGKCPQRCAALQSSVFLAPDGTVYPCSMWSQPLGNVRDCDFNISSLIRSSRAQSLRRDLVNKECPNCWTPCEAYPTLAANLIPRLLPRRDSKKA